MLCAGRAGSGNYADGLGRSSYLSFCDGPVGILLSVAGNTNPKRYRGSQRNTSLALRVGVEYLISGREQCNSCAESGF